MEHDDGPIAPRSLESWLNPDDTARPDDLRPETLRTDAAHYARQKFHPLKDVTPAALEAARSALRNAQTTGDAHLPEMIGPVADAVLAAGLDVIFREDTQHLIKLTWDSIDDQINWMIQHPLSCRPNLFACPYNDGVNDAHLTGRLNGVYECGMDDGGIVRLGKHIGD